jgi:hypothetical protein
MPKLFTTLTPEMQVMLQWVDDDEKITASAVFDRAGALDVSDKMRSLAQLIPVTDEKVKPKGH